MQATRLALVHQSQMAGGACATLGDPGFDGIAVDRPESRSEIRIVYCVILLSHPDAFF